MLRVQGLLIMKHHLLFISFIFLSAAGMAQSSPEFPGFGNRSLNEENKIQIFPNPTTDFLHVLIENSSLSKATVTVHNIIGNEFTVDTEKLQKNEFKVDVRQIPAGYYLLSVKDPAAGFSKTYKFLKR